MIQKIESKRVELPPIYLIENEEDFAQLPTGIPYIVGTVKELDFIRLYLEFQVLLRSCVKTNLAIKWEDCLKRLGYSNSLRKYTLNSGGTFEGSGVGAREEIPVEKFVEDQYLVSFDKLTELKILPTWLDDLRAAVETNIIDEVTFNPFAYNKQLGMNVGSAGMKHNAKNLLILDVSGSMPRGVVKTITNLAKLMSKKFYADIMLTSGRTIIIDYDKVQESDIIELARQSGSGNEGVMYRALVKENRVYNTVISFGDDDNPGYYSEGKEECNFKVTTLYSLHTNGNRTSNVTGYARWFKPEKTHIVKDWITTIS
jgi:hypothetical protein